MLLEEDPATLIRTTVANFNIAADRAAVSRVGDSLATLQQARDGHVRDASAALRRLARQRESLASRHDELVASARGASQHAADMARLDRHKFRVAKAASDLEMETERLQGQAQDLAARLQELELQGVDGGDGGGAAVGGDGGEDAAGVGGGAGAGGAGAGTGTGAGGGTVDDEVLLRLKVYRSLGIDLERDGEEGEFNRAVVRNDRKGDVHVVNIDRKFSRFFYANYFWQTL